VCCGAGGGIFTKAADVGADLVGKLEAGIPEDDPRNPATIADNVGDNVGDVAGMGADIFGSFAGSIIAAALIGTRAGMGTVAVALPMWVAAAGIVSSTIGMVAVRTHDGATQGQVLDSVRRGLLLAAALQLGFMAIVVWVLGVDWRLYATIIIGLACGRAIGLCAEFFTSTAYMPTRSIAKAGLAGPASVIIQGLSIGMSSTIPAALLIASCVLASVNLSGFYGLAIASVGLLSNLAISLATDAFGPVADNAGGIAEMAGMPPATRNNTDVLDALGNTTAAIGKGFAMASAVLTGLSLLTSYAVRVEITAIDILEAGGYTMAGALVGAMLPFAFSAVTMGAVAKAARGVVYEVRRQMREIPGLLEGTAPADYARCVEYVTKAALALMVTPAVIVVLPPLICGIGLGTQFLGGLLLAEIVVSFSLGLMMSAAGGSWDNAKKYVEAGSYGGRKSPAHAATVVGDTVGDPFKDTSGPSLNILVKLSTYMGVVLAPIYKAHNDIWWVAIILLGLLIILLPLWMRRVYRQLKGAAGPSGAAPAAAEAKAAPAAATAAAAAATTGSEASAAAPSGDHAADAAAVSVQVAP
jgi:K(+)-stimulated pyrophosphate-energized sodium pump